MDGSNGANDDDGDGGLAVRVTRQGIEHSQQDDRVYEHVVLENGLRVLLVQDHGTSKAGVSIAVHAGADQDPATHPGIAHFTEHLCFLGSEKYPETNAFKSFLSTCGGRSNASTSRDKTVYKFEVPSASLPGALDRFSGFFACPLFDDSCTRREVNQVDSEDSKNRTNDGRRMWQLIKALADQSHPFSNFSTGNLATLDRPELGGIARSRELVMAFHKQHYVAQNMALVAVSCLPASEIIPLLRSCGLHTIPSDPLLPADAAPAPAPAPAAAPAPVPAPAGKLPAPIPYQTLLASGPVLVRSPTLREMRQVRVLFPLPTIKPHTTCSPTSLLSHLLGDEGPGSAFAMLQDLRLATGLSVGTKVSTADFSLLEITVDLTDEGNAGWQRVLSIVMEHVRLVCSTPIVDLQSRWAEVAHMSRVRFRYQPKSRPFVLAPTLAGRLLEWPVEKVLSNVRLSRHVDGGLLAQFLSCLDPSRCFVVRLDKQFEEDKADPYDQIEPWYQIPYCVRQPPPPPQPSSPPALHLPPPNPFIPTSFTLTPAPSSPPITPTTTTVSTLTMYHKTAPGFGQPKASILMVLSSELAQFKPHLATLLTRIIDHSLQQQLYPALEAMSYSIHSHTHGIKITVGGFSQHVPALLLRVAMALSPSESRTYLGQDVFELVRERLCRQVRDMALSRPDIQAVRHMKVCLNQGGDLGVGGPSQTCEAYLKDLEETTLEDLLEFSLQLGRSCHITSLVHGNIAHADALRAVQSAAMAMSKPTADDNAADGHKGGGSVDADMSKKPKLRHMDGPAVPMGVLKLDRGVKHRLRMDAGSPKEVNSALVMHLQVAADDCSLHQRAMCGVVAQLVKEPLFTELRTKQALGYIVSLEASDVATYGFGVRGLTVRVVSKRETCDVLEERVEGFLDEYRTTRLEALTADEVNQVTTALARRIMEPPMTQSEEAGVFWGQVVRGTDLWEYKDVLVTAWEKVTVCDVLSFWDRHVSRGSPDRAALVVHVRGHPRPDAALGAAKAAGGGAVGDGRGIDGAIKVPVAAEEAVGGLEEVVELEDVAAWHSRPGVAYYPAPAFGSKL